MKGVFEMCVNLKIAAVALSESHYRPGDEFFFLEGSNPLNILDHRLADSDGSFALPTPRPLSRLIGADVQSVHWPSRLGRDPVQRSGGFSLHASFDPMNPLVDPMNLTISPIHDSFSSINPPVDPNPAVESMFVPGVNLPSILRGVSISLLVPMSANADLRSQDFDPLPTPRPANTVFSSQEFVVGAKRDRDVWDGERHEADVLPDVGFRLGRRRRMASPASSAPVPEAALLQVGPADEADPVTRFFDLHRSPDRGAVHFRRLPPVADPDDPSGLCFIAPGFDGKLRVLPDVPVVGSQIVSLGQLHAVIKSIAPSGAIEKLEEYDFVCKVGRDATTLRHEVALMTLLERPYNPHIMRHVFSYILPDGRRCLVMGRAENGDLHTFMNRLGNALLSDAERRLLAVHLLYQIADGLLHMHAHRMIHLDIKPCNILIDREAVAKVADFGISQQCAEGREEIPGCQDIGTIYYRAPELHPQINAFSRLYETPSGVATYKSDVWSTGVVFLTLIAPSFNNTFCLHSNQEDPLFFHGWFRRHEGRLDISAFSDILHGMLNQSVADRWSMAQVKDWCGAYILRQAETDPSITRDRIIELYRRVHASPEV